MSLHKWVLSGALPALLWLWLGSKETKKRAGGGRGRTGWGTQSAQPLHSLEFSLSITGRFVVASLKKERRHVDRTIDGGPCDAAEHEHSFPVCAALCEDCC